MRVLVTGATGFLGAQIARAVVEHGHDLHVLMRPESSRDRLAGVPCVVRMGDVLDYESVLAAVAGVDAVIHCAGVLRQSPGYRSHLYRVNVGGTRNVLDAAHWCDVKVVYTSSVAAVGTSREPVAMDEGQQWNLEDSGCAYARSKYLAEQLAFDRAALGQHVVVLNPGRLLGPGGDGVGSTRLVVEYLRGRLPFLVRGGLSVSDVRDVADCHVQALENGVSGERYILAGHNRTLSQIATDLERLTGGPRVRRAPLALAKAVACLSELASRFGSHDYEELNLPFVRRLGSYAFYDSTKAQREIGYTIRPYESILRDTINDLSPRLAALN